MRALRFALRHPHRALMALIDVPLLGSGVVLLWLWRPGWQAWVNVTAVAAPVVVLAAATAMAWRLTRR